MEDWKLLEAVHASASVPGAAGCAGCADDDPASQKAAKREDLRAGGLQGSIPKVAWVVLEPGVLRAVPVLLIDFASSEIEYEITMKTKNKDRFGFLKKLQEQHEVSCHNRNHKPWLDPMKTISSVDLHSAHFKHSD